MINFVDHKSFILSSGTNDHAKTVITTSKIDDGGGWPMRFYCQLKAPWFLVLGFWGLGTRA